jgi:hypothetical protein
MPERRTNPSAIKRHLSPSSLLSSLGSGNGADGGSQKAYRPIIFARLKNNNWESPRAVEFNSRVEFGYSATEEYDV